MYKQAYFMPIISLGMMMMFLVICSSHVASGLSGVTRVDHRRNQWEVHRTIRDLEEEPGAMLTYETTTENVLEVLRGWSNANTGKPSWRSLLNKANLRHEIEESIVALHHLREWSSSLPDSASFIAVDLCCGKGIFSMLLSYLSPEHYPCVDRIILMDKDMKIDWSHIEAANEFCEQEGRPFLEVWAGANIHEHDDLVATLTSYNKTLALTGIHLCKTLSPAMVGLVNGLGSQQAPYICLAPCCLPRIQQLSVPQFESPMQRNARLLALRHRTAARARRRSKCYMCQSDHHVRDCPNRHEYPTKEAWDQAITLALAARPCWNCGVIGHQRADCTVTVDITPQPTTSLDMNVVASSSTPFETYCDLLSQSIQDSSIVRVLDSGLTTASHEKQHNNNWNQYRKSVFIVVERNHVQ